jgi:two-component system OmpR family response regulator
VLRRAGTARLAMLPKERVFSFEGWQLETARRQLCRSGGALVPLRAAEYELLLAFIEHPQRVLSRDQLLDLARGRSSSPFDRSVDVLVSRLRRKIETDPEAPRLIQTVRGGGYIFSAVVDSDEAALCA